MVIDRKFIIAAQNPVSGNKYSHENALLLCAKDKAVPAALEAYKQKCIELGCDIMHIESIQLLIERVEIFQAKNGAKVPDTQGDELIRCIDGVGV